MKILRILLSVFLLLLTLYSGRSHATTNDFSLIAGNLTQFVKKIQIDDKGGTHSIEWNPLLGIGFNKYFDSKWGLYTDAAFTWPQEGTNSNITKTIFLLDAYAGYRLTDSFVLKAGLGVVFTMISGKGGKQVLNNGTSTDEFTLPSQTRVARNMNIDLGSEYFFNNQFSAQANLMIYTPFESVSRQYSYIIGISYHFGEIL